MIDKWDPKHNLSRPLGPFKRMQPTVFFGSAALVVAFCIFGGGFTATAANTFESIQGWIVTTLGWYYMLITSAGLITTASANSTRASSNSANPTTSLNSGGRAGSQCCSPPAWAPGWCSGAWPSR